MNASFERESNEQEQQGAPMANDCSKNSPYAQYYIHIEQHRLSSKPARWYRCGWLWLMVAVIAVGVLFVGLSDIADVIASVNGSIENHTAAVEKQTTMLESVKNNLDRVWTALKEVLPAE